MQAFEKGCSLQFRATLGVRQTMVDRASTIGLNTAAFNIADLQLWRSGDLTQPVPIYFQHRPCFPRDLLEAINAINVRFAEFDEVIYALESHRLCEIFSFLLLFDKQIQHICIAGQQYLSALRMRTKGCG